MCRWAVFHRTLLALLLLIFVACQDSDDGGGPTEPPDPLPRVDGLWSGTFSTTAGDSVASFNLIQRGRDVSGVVSVGAIEWSLRGEVDSEGTFRWRTGDESCGSFDGTTDLITTTHMEGSADLDRFFCADRQRLAGDLDLNLQRR